MGVLFISDGKRLAWWCGKRKNEGKLELKEMESFLDFKIRWWMGFVIQNLREGICKVSDSILVWQIEGYFLEKFSFIWINFCKLYSFIQDKVLYNKKYSKFHLLHF